jgi:predicted dehydrogenase
MRKIRLGMVGGGPGSMIGPAHRRAVALDGRFELVAGAFSRDRHKSLVVAAELDIAEERIYATFEQMAELEARREDGIEAVSIVTPNDTHARASTAFLERGIHVLCYKPMAVTLEEAVDVFEAQRRSGALFALTHNYAAYPMVREARERVANGALGRVRVVQVEHAQGGRSRLVEASGDAQTAWRTDPSVAGPAAVLADLGVHAHHLARYVTGLELEAVSATLATVVPGRTSHDDAQVSLRFSGGGRGALWASFVAAGNGHGLRLRVFGEDGSLEWAQSDAEVLHLRPLEAPGQVLRRGEPWLGEAQARASRIKAGHPEGFFEAFATLYSDVAECIRARQERREPDRFATTVAGARDGVLGLRFVEASLESDRLGSAWVDATWTPPAGSVA